MSSRSRPRQKARAVALLVGACFGLALAWTPVSDPARASAAVPSFVKTGSMAKPRLYHTATLLLDGRVLIVGGSDDRSALATAELYDPKTGRFTNTGSLLHARQRHTATLLADGRVLIAGGIGTKGPPSGFLTSAELYDPATGLFKATGPMLHARFSHTATLLPNGRVLMAGANGATAELYDPKTGRFVATGSMSFIREDFVASLLSNGQVLIAGGTNFSCTSFTAPPNCKLFSTLTELYNPATGKFRATGPLAKPRVGAAATPLSTGLTLVAGGQLDPHHTLATADLFDPKTGKFRATGSMAHARYDKRATVLSDGRTLITGGVNNSATSIGTAEVYDPSTGKFSAAGSMSVVRSSHTATLLQDGRVLVTGGLSDVRVLNSAEIWQP